MDRIIVSTGYMGSGSSAITDLIAEFKNCANDYKSYEYVLMHSPNGIFDLEDKLLVGNNAVRSDEAIRTFRKHMKKLYDKKFWWVGNYKKIIGPNFMNLTDEYIESLINFNYSGYWYNQEDVDLRMFIKLMIRKPIKILTLNKIKFKKVLKYNDGLKICLPTREEFYKKTHDYIYKIIEEIGKGRENIILDQFLLPFNLYRIDNYFDDKLKVIVVERDPRDVFILNKYTWQKKQIGIPVPTDVNDFCDYYKRMRESEINSNSKKILRIKFEDLIYKYEDTLEKIKKFMNFSNKDHIAPKSRFNPEISIKNTQLFKNKEYEKEIKIIERKLKKYLYDFPYDINNKIEETVEFD